MNKPLLRELVINATAFKAKSLKLLDDLDAGKLDKITVTKRGKPVAVVQGAPATRPPRFEDLWGCMKGTLVIPDDVDLTAPTLDEDWEEEMLKDWDDEDLGLA